MTRQGLNGERLVLDGTHAWIDQDHEEGFQPAIFFKVQDQFGDYNEWKQSFPEEGGMTLSPLENYRGSGLAKFQLSPEGKLTAEFEDRGYHDVLTVQAETRREGEALIARNGSYEFGIAPPVPVEWLIGS